MEKILILNSGSTSMKFQLFKMDKNIHQVVCQGLVERIGQMGSKITVKSGAHVVYEEEFSALNHKAAIKEVLGYLLKKDLKNIDELSAVGHRMGHGVEYFDGSVIIDDAVMAKIHAAVPLMPLHGPAFIAGKDAISEILPNVLQVATFDNAFHQSIEKCVFNYAIPREYYENDRVRKYGFHGASHAYAALKTKEMFGRMGKFITCHLGGGASITAIHNNKSMDTTMGFTPAAGLFMATRVGDIDPYIPLHIMKTQNMSADDVDKMFNKECGLKGLTEGHTDMRDIIHQAELGDEKCQFAIDAFVYSVIKAIGGYVAVLGGVDAITFTGGIGENSDLIRQRVCEKLAYLGLKLDVQKNKERPVPYEIATEDSLVKVYVVPANEELMMAEDTYRLLLSSRDKEAIAV